jgi:Flp pilus assembly protein TadD
MQNLSRRLCHLGASLVFALAALPGHAADDSAPAPAGDKLGAARTQIAAKNWPGAITELQRVNDTGSADWNNLMGYSLRKSATPDHAGAEKFYDAALRIEPAHRGALEYSGELYLVTGNLPKAEERLAILEKACKAACEEYADLKKSVARYKANGNKVVAQ